MADSFAIVWRASISTRPRLPTTTTRPLHRQQAEIGIEVHVREHLDNRVDALPVCERENLFCGVGCPVLDRVLRPLLPHQGETGVTPRGADHGTTRGGGKLGRGDADGAACAMDEHGLSRLDLGPAEEGAMRRRVWNADRCALRKGKPSRKGMNLVRETDDSRCVCPCTAPAEVPEK
jgi:hypothetical protein